MERNSISGGAWASVIAATFAGMAVGGVLLGPPGLAALGAAFGRIAYKHYRDMSGAR